MGGMSCHAPSLEALGDDVGAAVAVVRAVHALPPAFRARKLLIADEALTRGRPPEPLTHGEVFRVIGGLHHRERGMQATHGRCLRLRRSRYRGWGRGHT